MNLSDLNLLAEGGWEIGPNLLDFLKALLIQVCPARPINDAPNQLASDMISDSKMILPCPGCIVLANGSNLFCSKLVLGVFLAAKNGAVNDSVCEIRFVGIPSQVAKLVVLRVSVWKVTAFHAFRTMANKSFENQLVNQPCASRQVDLSVAAGKAWLKSLPYFPNRRIGAAARPSRPHAAIVANAVARKTGTLPVGDGRIVGSHSHLRIVGCGQGRRCVTSTRLPACIIAARLH